MQDNPPFRLRAHEVSRIEAFSDIVFGFALTLIVVSLEVPESYEELMRLMRGFLGFAICFAVLMWIWHEHYTFFRRYALTDGYTVVLNTMLLFLVLYYVYPLKFIFSIVTHAIEARGAGDGATLFVIYGLGFAGIFALLLFLNLHAYHRRDELQLNEHEVHDTRTSMMLYIAYIIIAIVSTMIAAVLPAHLLGLAGWIYFLLGPVSAVIGARRSRKRRLL
jgi:uncharacterized membrane protein